MILGSVFVDVTVNRHDGAKIKTKTSEPTSIVLSASKLQIKSVSTSLIV